MNSYFDPFNELTDELIDKARPPFDDAIKRLKIQLAGRFDLYPRDLDAEGARLCDEIEAADKVIIACCKHYCELGLDQFNRFTSPSLRRRVAASTAQLKALIPALNSHTARLRAFLDTSTAAPEPEPVRFLHSNGLRLWHVLFDRMVNLSIP